MTDAPKDHPPALPEGVEANHLYLSNEAIALIDELCTERGLDLSDTLGCRAQEGGGGASYAERLLGARLFEIQTAIKRQSAAPPLHTGPRALGGVIAVITEWAGTLNGRFSRSDFPMISHRDIRELAASLGGVEQQEGLGSSAQEADTHRAPEAGVVDHDILFWAFRYALGRMTYAVDQVGGVIIKNAEALPDITRQQMVVEIRKARAVDGLGMPLDAKLWGEVEAALLAAPNRGERSE